MSKELEEGKVIEIADELDINAVSEEIPEGKDKVSKDDKDFEDFKALYKGLIDDKCKEEYGSCEDEKLWNDIAKELFLNSKYYIPNEEELKPEKIEESKELTEGLKGKTLTIIYDDKDDVEHITHFYCDKDYDIDGEQIKEAIKASDKDIVEIKRMFENKKVNSCDKKLTEDMDRVQNELLKRAKEWISEMDEEDQEYYSKWSDDEIISEWFSSELYPDDVIDLCKEINIDTYNGNLQLSDDHVLFDIVQGLDDKREIDEMLYGEDVTRALEDFENECKELDDEVYTDGRMGRHIVIKPTLQNIINYDTIKEQYMEDQQSFIDSQIYYYNHPEEFGLEESKVSDYTLNEIQKVLDSDAEEYGYTLKIVNADKDIETKTLDIDKEDLEAIYKALSKNKIEENISPLTDTEKTNYYYGTVKSSIPYNVYKIDNKFYDGNGLEIDKEEIDKLVFFEAKFSDKVKAIKKSLKANDKRLSDETAEEQAKKIAGSMIKNESRDRAAETLGKFIYDLGDEAWSYDGEKKTSMGRTLYVIRRNGEAKLNHNELDAKIGKEYPELFPIALQDDALIYEKKKSKKEAKALKEEKEPEQTLEDLVDFLNANDIKRDNIEDNQEKVEKYLANEHLGMTQYIPGVFAIAQFNGEDRKKIGRIIYYSGKNGGWGFHRDTFALENKELNEAKIDKAKLEDIYNRLMDIDEELQDLESEGITIKDNSGHTIADNLVLVINPLLDFMENNEDIDDITPELHYKKGGLEFYENKKLNEEVGTFQDYLAYCKDLNLDKNKPATLNKYLKDFGKYVAAIYGLKDYDEKIADAKKDIKANLNEDKSYEFINSEEALDDSDLMELIAAIYDKLGIEIDETYDNVIEDIDNENIFFQNIDGKKVLTFDNGDKIAYCTGRDSANIPVVEIDIDNTESLEENKGDLTQDIIEVVGEEVKANRESGLLEKEHFVENCIKRLLASRNIRILAKEDKATLTEYAEEAYDKLVKFLSENKKCVKEELIPVEELPDTCYGVLPSDCSIIIIKKGIRGYYRTNKDYEKEYEDIEDWNARMDAADEVADRLNAEIGVTPNERSQMEARSINGNW